MIPIHLAVEDELSEVVLRRLLQFVNRGYAVGTAYRRGGYGYLRRTIAGWNRAAQGIPFLVLTDLDQALCPSALLREWLPQPKHPNLLFRVAVREVEAWLLGDHEHLSAYLGCALKKMPAEPEALADPKATLIELARKSRSALIRDQIVPRAGSTAKQGPAYNACLTKFVREAWDVEEAATRTPSLARALVRLREFKPRW